MPIIVSQLFDSTNVESEFKIINNKETNYFKSAEILYKVDGALDEKEAILATQEAADKTYLDMVLYAFSVNERVSEKVWKIEAKYKAIETESSTSTGNTDEGSYAFDTTGGTKKITHSIKTVAKASGSPDSEQAINYDGEKVQGLEITSPVSSFTESHIFKPSKVSTPYKKTVASMTGKVNSSGFKGYAKGEVLFLGASGQRRGDSSDSVWEITFKFAVSPNITKSFKVGDLSLPGKEGWQYMWVRYAPDVDDSAEALTSKAIGAYVEQVYEYDDFKKLGIGS